MNDPIFIIGTERSGTNLLRLILNSHSGIAVPHPPHIMKFFQPLLPLYGDLSQERNFRRLIGDVCRVVELHPYSWEMRPDREAVFGNAEDRDLMAVYFEVYDQYRAYAGKRRWACKSTFMIEHVAEVLRRRPGAKFIYMVRDGRDVAVSAKSSIFNRCHAYYVAELWSREQRLGLSWLSRLPAERIMLLKYEELLRDPGCVTERICSFLGEPFEDRMLEYHRSGEASKSGGLSLSWKNTSMPVMRDNAGKYRRLLSEKEVLLFETVAGEELKELGYGLAFPGAPLEKGRMTPGARFSYRAGDALLRIRAEARHMLRDKSTADRLKKLGYLRYLRLMRGLQRFAGAGML
ncbi:MAG: sulfotransferase [Nitrospiraceae bacterium]|nr:sulfotransferase [Nitrospiraceae bacterium]